jgi:hypothetical protein
LARQTHRYARPVLDENLQQSIIASIELGVR